MSDLIHIGDWEFSRSTGVLSKGTITNRLEHRAASLLELLCRQNGDLVTHADIIEKVWDGRSISPNSIAVVIADIRRALGDNAKHPEYLETLPKRGYRMKAPVRILAHEPAEISESVLMGGVSDSELGGKNTSPSLKLWGGVIVLSVILLASFFYVKSVKASPQPLIVSIAPITNDTQNTDYDALAIALTELLETELMRTERYEISLKDETDIVIGGRVILWSGHAALSLRANGAQGETVLWSGMASGPEDRLPSQLRREVAELTASFEKGG